mgnify:FL=1
MLFCGFAQSGLAQQFETEPNNSESFADAVVPGTPLTGQLSSEGDQDWFSFAATSPSTITINFDSPTNTTSEHHTVEVRDGSLTLLARRKSGSDVVFDVGVAGTGAYYVIVKDGPDPFDVETGKYSVTVTVAAIQMLEQEPNDSTATANTLGQQISGQLQSENDLDWYVFQTSSSGVLDLTFDSPTDTTSEHHTIEVRDSSNNLLGGINTGRDITAQIGLSSAGTFHIVVKDGPDPFDFESGSYSVWISHTGLLEGQPVAVTICTAIEINWNSRIGNTYYVEWSPNLTGDSWLPLSPMLPGTGSEMSYLDSSSGVSSKFYRVVERRN